MILTIDFGAFLFSHATIFARASVLLLVYFLSSVLSRLRLFSNFARGGSVVISRVSSYLSRLDDYHVYSATAASFFFLLLRRLFFERKYTFVSIYVRWFPHTQIASTLQSL